MFLDSTNQGWTNSVCDTAFVCRTQLSSLHATATPPATRFVSLPTRDTATEHVVHCISKLRHLPVPDPPQYMRVFNSLSTMLATLFQAAVGSGIGCFETRILPIRPAIL